LANTPRGEHDRIRLKRHHLLGELVQTPNACNAVLRLAMMALNQIDGQGVRPQVNPLVSLGIGGEGALNFPAGCIFGVQDSFAGMAAFFHKGKIAVAFYLEDKANGEQLVK
jgi:hypothetical protein